MKHLSTKGKIVLAPNYWVIAFCLFSIVHSIYLEINDIQLFRDYTPNWLLVLGYSSLVIWLWKSIVFNEEGFCVSRLHFFRKYYKWLEVEQIVETTLKTGQYERIVLLLILKSIMRGPFERGENPNDFVSRNRKHVIVCDIDGHAKWENICELKCLIETVWGKIT